MKTWGLKTPAARVNVLRHVGLWPTAIRLSPLWKTEVRKSASIKPWAPMLWQMHSKKWKMVGPSFINFWDQFTVSYIIYILETRYWLFLPQMLVLGYFELLLLLCSFLFQNTVYCWFLLLPFIHLWIYISWWVSWVILGKSSDWRNIYIDYMSTLTISIK